MLELAEYPINKILLKIGKNQKFLILNGYKTRINNNRLRLFKKNIKCIRCGRIGNIFILEKTNNKDVSPHLNMYNINKNGDKILMTKDHIKPKSRGGLNIMKNLQTMCCHCNTKKADKYKEG